MIRQKDSKTGDGALIDALKQPKGFYRNVFALMIPMILQNLITQTVSLTDALMVGMLGERFLAAMPVALVPLFVVMIFTFGVQSGLGVLVSQYWGKGNIEVINRVLGIALYVTIAVTISVALVLNLFPYNILGLVTSDKGLVAIAVPYARITSFSMALNSISLVYLACHRSMENPRLGAIVLSISAVFSIFWNWVLIFGNLGFPALGIQGAAISTLCARTLEVIIISVHAFLNSRFRVKLKLLIKPGLVITRDFFKYALPVLINEAFWGIGFMMFPVIFGHMTGAQQILAAYSLSNNLDRLFAVALFASAGAAAIIVGREIGAGRKDRAKSAAKALAVLGLILGFLSGIMLMLAQHTVLGPLVFPLYDLSGEASHNAFIMLTIVAISLPLRAVTFSVGLGAFRGGGDVKAFMYIDVGTLYLISLPIAAFTGLVLGLSLEIVYSSILIENVIKTAIIILRLRSGKWIHDVTRESIS